MFVCLGKVSYVAALHLCTHCYLKKTVPPSYLMLQYIANEVSTSVFFKVEIMVKFNEKQEKEEM